MVFVNTEKVLDRVHPTVVQRQRKCAATNCVMARKPPSVVQPIAGNITSAITTAPVTRMKSQKHVCPIAKAVLRAP